MIAAAHSGEIVFWGRGAQQTFGYSAGEMIGQPLSAIVRLPRLRAGGTFRVDATRKGGESFRAGVVVEPLSQADDAPMSIVVRDESRWSLFADFVDIVTQHRTFAAAAPRVAEAIGRTLDFEAVAVWATDGAAPHRTVWWSANGGSLRESGLVERVRRSGESATGEDAMAFPIVDRTLVVHVLEVFCRPDSDYHQSIIDDLARIAGSAGRFVSRERMSVALRESEERYRLLFEESVAAVCTATARGLITAANVAFAQMFGFDDSASVKGIRLETLLTDRAEWKQLLQQIEQGGGAANREMQGLRRDHPSFWMLLSVTPLVDGRDSLQITAIDIDQRKRAEDELREVARIFSEAHELSSSGVFEQSSADRVRASDGLYRILGLEPQSRPLTLRFFFRHVVADDRDRLRGAIELARQRGAIDVKIRILRDDGDVRFVRVHARLREDKAGLRAVGKVLDVTEEELAARDRVELQRQLGETRRLSSLGQLAATMAHEFNNVLMGISTFAEVLRRRTAGEVPVQNAVAQIQQSLGRGRRITDEILRFTRDPAPAMATIDVRRWLTDFLPEASALAGDRAELQVEEELFIRGDIALLNQVLANLIINARDAAPEGAIRIIARAPGDERLDLVIADSGSGIPPENRERIFEPLFTTKRGGTGLGLAVVHQAVSAQGGTIEVESEVGRGTEFHLRFPLVASEGELSDGRPVSRVLLVEDDPAVTLALSAVLEVEGIGVRTATSGRAAINSLAKEIPDVVLLDIGLPDLSGADVYTEIATRWPHLPVVFITAELDDSAVAQFLRRPHIGFLRKPFEAEQLLETLSRITAAKRPQSGRKSVSGRPSGSRRPK